MVGVLLRLLPLAALLVVLLAVWYPVSEVVGVEAMDWPARYEREHSPSPFGFGALSAMRETLRRQNDGESLAEFIARETDGRLVPVTGDGWTPLVDIASRQPGHRVYVATEAVPMTLRNHDTVYAVVGTGANATTLWLNRTPTADLWSWEDVPAGLLYPLRGWWPLMLGGLAGAVGLRWAGSGGLAHQPKARAAATTHGKAVVWTLGMVLVGGALMGMPHIYGIWGADIGFAATMVGLLLVLTGLIAGVLFIGAVGALDRLLSGRERLVCWSYPEAEWMAFIGATQDDQRQRAKALIAVIGGMMVLIGGGFLIFAEDTEAALVTVGVLAVVFVLVLITAVVSPWLTARTLRRGPFEIHIGPRALCVGQQSHVWGGLLGRFEGAKVETDGARTLLLVRYSVLQATGGRALSFYRRYETVAVPVPAGHEDDARRVARSLTAGTAAAQPES